MRQLINKLVIRVKKSFTFATAFIITFVILAVVVINVNFPKAHANSTAITSEQVHLTLAPVAKKVIPAVVNIYAEKLVTERVSPFGDDAIRNFFGNSVGGTLRKRLEKSLGSGVIIDKSGLIVTNNHVINGATKIKIILSDRREYIADLVGTTVKYDIALLKIRDLPRNKTLHFLPFARSENVQVGDFVIAIGDPFGLGQTVTSGIVSSAHRSGLSPNGSPSVYIQTDASINRGNSGGALVNTSGEFIGMNTFIYTPTGGSIGMGFAIPSNFIKHIVKNLKEYHKITPIYAGVTLQDLSNDMAVAKGLDAPQGVLVTDVAKGSSVAKAGIMPGDIILKINHNNVNSTGDFGYYLMLHDIGETVQITRLAGSNLSRDTVGMVLEKLEGTLTPKITYLKDRTPLQGLGVANLNPMLADKFKLKTTTKGVIVLNIQPNTISNNLGFQPGDIINRISTTKISTARQLEAQLRKNINSRSWSIQVIRNNRAITLNFRD